MRRRTALLATVISTAGLGAGAALASAGPAETAGPPAGTKQVVLRQTSFKFLDHPPLRRGDVPPSPGDASILSYRVLDAGGQKRLGRADAICTSTDRRGKRLVCTVEMTLPDGVIMLEGPGDPLAITGGTGVYAGARGVADGHDHQGTTTLTLTFMP
jgi:hypothetical protein